MSNNHENTMPMLTEEWQTPENVKRFIEALGCGMHPYCLGSPCPMNGYITCSQIKLNKLLKD
jgi:hypothetical protein